MPFPILMEVPDVIAWEFRVLIGVHSAGPYALRTRKPPRLNLSRSPWLTASPDSISVCKSGKFSGSRSLEAEGVRAAMVTAMDRKVWFSFPIRCSSDGMQRQAPIDSVIIAL
ncbi:hypothetical protein RRF57_013074 [Xylaria bambusicola]|uniref:Uncharacterized protein n=1 Tax=Xylaria bambusicola TaxID=326684 RepID=A0AAN7UW99_9PEZI